MRSLLGLLISIATLSDVAAAEIKTVSGKDGRSLIVLSGEIAAGDTDVFKAAVKSANDAGKVVANVRLSSIGGNLIEGVKLADAVRFGKISTNVGKDAVCASACFLVFAAGATKFANYSAQIGVHGASTTGGEEAGDGTVAMARVAKELGVPPAIIGRMVVTPPKEIVWLTPQDLQSMGTTMVGRPAQVATVDQSAPVKPQTDSTPGAPMQLQGAEKASAPPNWEEFLAGALRLSSEQNNGRAATFRTCQPEFKICINAVSYSDSKGRKVIAKVTKDMNDKIVRREACTYHASEDIRTCLDWDNGGRHRDMQDAKGNWTKIADE